MENSTSKKSVIGRKYQRNFGPILGFKRANNSGDFEKRFKVGYHLEINFIGKKFKNKICFQFEWIYPWFYDQSEIIEFCRKSNLLKMRTDIHLVNYGDSNRFYGCLFKQKKYKITN